MSGETLDEAFTAFLADSGVRLNPWQEQVARDTITGTPGHVVPVLPQRFGRSPVADAVRAFLAAQGWTRDPDDRGVELWRPPDAEVPTQPAGPLDVGPGVPTELGRTNP